MTRELIEDFTKIVKPFVQKKLLEENFEGMGEQDKDEFGRDFDEILSLAIKGLESSAWIPVTERLPEEMFGCLVTVWDANPKTGEEFENILPEFVGYDGETWNGANGKPIAFEVVAWMPLPKSYRGDNNGK